MCIHICIYVYMYGCLYFNIQLAPQKQTATISKAAINMSIYVCIYIIYMSIYVNINQYVSICLKSSQNSISQFNRCVQIAMRAET